MQRILLDNFRVFGAPAAFELAPVTILTGKNNSGKSSLIKAFLVLADYLEQADQTVLRLDGPRAAKHKITSFDQLLNRQESQSGRNDTRLSYTKGQYEFTYEFDAAKSVEPITASLKSFRMINLASWAEMVITREAAHYHVEVKQQLIDEVTDTDREDMYYNVMNAYEDGVTGMDEMISSINALDATQDEHSVLEAAMLGNPRPETPERAKDVICSADVYLHELLNDSPSLARLIQYGLIKFIGANDERRQQQFRFGLGGEHKVLVEFLQRVNILMQFRPDHLGPNRTYQERLIRAHGSTGEIARIAEDYVRYQAAKGEAANVFLAKWLVKLEIGEAVTVEQLEGTTYRILVHRDGQDVNLADMGFGAGQLLSILLLMAINIRRQELEGGRVSFQHNVKLLIEEPESNLHPRLQSLLADLFLEAAHHYRLAFLIETHSEYLIRKMQLLLAGGHYHPEYVILHYLERTKHLPSSEDASNTPVYKMDNRAIYIQADGKLTAAFGAGFFDEAADAVMELNQQQLQNYAQ